MRSDGSLSSSATNSGNQSLSFVSHPDTTNATPLHPGIDVSQISSPEDRFRKKPLHLDPEVTTLYFLAGAGLIKIGISNGLTSRIRSIRNSSPVPLELIATWPATSFEERRLHRKFWKLRRHGEWFEDEGSIRAHIEHLVRNHGAKWGETEPAQKGSNRTFGPCLS